MAVKRDKANFWVTWIAALMSGDEVCEWKYWIQGHYKYVEKVKEDMSDYNRKHTALLKSIEEEYQFKVQEYFKEDQTAWSIVGRFAEISGKMDIVTVDPNLVIDAKTGREKDSHLIQIQIYMLALEYGAVAPVKQHRGFTGILRYGDNPVEVREIPQDFKKHFFATVNGLLGDEPPKRPSKRECKYCKIKNCDSRWKDENEVTHTDEF